MELEKVISIIKVLSDGIDPYTGEQYPPDSPYQAADTVRALTAAISALEKQQKSIVRQQNLPSSAGNPWDEDENARLLQAYDLEISINDIAKAHGRTVGAIKSRLVKYGKLKNS